MVTTITVVVIRNNNNNTMMMMIIKKVSVNRILLWYWSMPLRRFYNDTAMLTTWCTQTYIRTHTRFIYKKNK